MHFTLTQRLKAKLSEGIQHVAQDIYHSGACMFMTRRSVNDVCGFVCVRNWRKHVP